MYLCHIQTLTQATRTVIEVLATKSVDCGRWMQAWNDTVTSHISKNLDRKCMASSYPDQYFDPVVQACDKIVPVPDYKCGHAFVVNHIPNAVL